MFRVAKEHSKIECSSPRALFVGALPPAKRFIHVYLTGNPVGIVITDCNLSFFITEFRGSQQRLECLGASSPI